MNICFLSTYSDDIYYNITTGYNIKVRNFQNGFSYVTKIKNYYLINTDNIDRNIVKELESYDKIYFSVFFRNILLNPDIQKILDSRFILGGPAINFCYFYDKELLLCLEEKYNITISLDYIETKFENNNNVFNKYWNENLELEINSCSSPINNYTCEKIYESGSCSFCSYSKIFTEKFYFSRDSTKCIESFFQNSFKNKYIIHLVEGSLSGFHIIDYIKTIKKYNISNENMSFYLNGLFNLDIQNSFKKYKEIKYNDKFVISISLESFDYDDLHFINKKYFNYETANQIIHHILDSGFRFKTNLIFNCRSHTYTKEYISQYMLNLRKFINIVYPYRETCYVYVYPYIKFFKRNDNIDFLKSNYKNYEFFVKKVLYELCKNDINVYYYKTLRRVWSI